MSSVSFIIPVFNKAKYLNTVINSLMCQNGDFKREYIFIDDGSTDNSLSIIKTKSKKLRNCKIVSQKNKGSAKATNVGIKLARMKYIKFLDADDILINEATISLLNILEKNDDVILAYGLQRKVKDIKNTKLNDKFDPKDTLLLNKPIELAMRNSMFNPSQFMVRTKICKKVNGCDERVVFSQEYSLTLKLANEGNFVRLNYPIAILPESAPGQISEKKNNQIYRVSKSLEFFLKDNPQLPLRYKLYAQRRLTARAWRFARNKKMVSYFIKHFSLYVLGILRINFRIIKVCEEANTIYENLLD